MLTLLASAALRLAQLISYHNWDDIIPPAYGDNPPGIPLLLQSFADKPYQSPHPLSGGPFGVGKLKGRWPLPFMFAISKRGPVAKHF